MTCLVSRLLPVVLLRVFIRLVVTDGAAGCRANQSMMAGDMPSNAPDGSAFEATLGISRRAPDCQGNCQCDVAEKRFHC